MAEVLPASASEVRPLPASVPISVRASIVKILGEPAPGEKEALVVTPTVTRDAVTGEYDLRLKLAAMRNFGNGWSFGGFMEWEPKDGDFAAGVELKLRR